MGQLLLVPVQLSATSQTPVEARQTVDVGAKPSAGQALVEPVQLSVASQVERPARQTVVDAAKE